MEELLQFEKWKGRSVYSNGLLSTSILLSTAKGFAKFNMPIEDGYVRVLFQIEVDMDYTNDYGTYIREYSNAKDEEEWLLSYGIKLEI